MPQPGWYPDPSGAPGRFRWFDGTSWTGQTTTDPSAAGSTPGPRRRWFGLLGVLALVLVLVVAAVVVGVRSLGRDQTSTPSSTVSGFDDSKVTPTPSASGPHTGSPSPSPSADGQTVGPRPARCDASAPDQLPQPANDDRVGGPLTFATRPSPWTTPYHETRMPYGRDAWAQALVLPEKKPWAASATVGVTAFDRYQGSAAAARTMLQCVLTSAYYVSVEVHLQSSTSQPVTVDGRSGTRLDAVISFSDPELTTKGSALRLVVVDTRPATFLFTATPVERDDLRREVDQLTRTLAVS